MFMFNCLLMQTTDSIITSMSDTLEAFPPVQYLLVLLRICTDFLMDRTVLVIISFLLGMIVILATELILFWKYFNAAPTLPPPKFEEMKAHLPEVLRARLEHSSLKQKEECIWLNFLLQFLFSELKDSMKLRRFLTKKIQMEFEEVLRSRSGVLVDELFLRDFRLGDSFPVIMGMSVEKSEVSNGVIQTLNLKMRVAYDGGFQIAIDAALPFHRMAFVSVTILKLRGLVRLQFTQIPFSHWSMAFYEEPELDVDVTAQLDGRPMPKLKNIIANQIRKIIRKKHTLPMYKMRFKPFFLPHLDGGQSTDAHIHMDGAELGHGILEVMIIEANQLPFVIKGAQVYCTVSVDELPWKEQRMKERSNRKVITVELVKHSSDQSLGMMVQDELLPDRLNPVVVIGEVNVGSPAYMASIQQGDILVGVGGSKVTSAKQAMKNLKWAKDRIQVQIERVGSEISTSTKDETSPRKVNSCQDVQTTEKIVASDIDSASNLSAPPSTSTGSPKVKNKIPREDRRTVSTEASANPHWNQKFVFSVDSTHNYLNVCLWSRGGDRSAKPDMITCGKQDVILGYVNLNLGEIYLHCLVTLNGRMQDKVKLKHGHFKTEDELVKAWSVHKGWDMNQMYGNISLSFHYIPTNMSQDQRRDASIKIHHDLLEKYETNKEDVQSKPSPTRVAEDFKRDLNEGHHQFGTATFMTAIFCDYCGKKIWMKEAFKCQTCGMVCHKKCLVKCLGNTACTESGAKKRSSLSESWEPLAGTSKVKNLQDEAVRNFGLPEEESADNLTTVTDASLNTSESMQNLTNDFDVVSLDSEHKGLAGSSRQENTQEVNSLTRFRGLKEQTDRMKDSVLKHLRRNKIPAAFNDKAILSAKELGARLFSDMDPSLRKDKLEGMVKKLDQELKAEMENKELIEQELALLEAVEQKTPSSKRKSEIKSLSNKVFRSVEKQDAMRLLMLQYCSGLQNCINSLEAEVNSANNRSEFIDGQMTSQQDFEQPKVSRSAAVGGFVRRASSSVKEKMSFIKKDFGKKGLKSGEDDRMSTLRSVEYDKMATSKSGDDDRMSTSRSVEYDKMATSKSGDDDRMSTSKSVEYDKMATSKSGEDDRMSTSRSVEYDKMATSKSGDDDRMSTSRSVEYYKISTSTSITGEYNKTVTFESSNKKIAVTRSREINKISTNTTGEDPSSFDSKDISGVNATEERDIQSSQDNSEEAEFHRKSYGKNHVSMEDPTAIMEIKEISGITEMTAKSSDVAVDANHPAIEIYVDEVDKPVANGNKTDNLQDPNKSSFLNQDEAGIPRSSSDSRLEINKMLSLRPEDILRYHGTSLPRLSVIDDSDSDSDYLIIDSSDEPVVTDSSDSDNEQGGVDFKGVNKKPDNEDSDDGRDQHRGTIQQLQTFQV